MSDELRQLLIIKVKNFEMLAKFIFRNSNYRDVPRGNATPVT